MKAGDSCRVFIWSLLHAAPHPPLKVTARVQRVSPKATQPVRDRTETRARITCPQNSGSFHFVEFISIGNVQN